MPQPISQNTLFYGDNLPILRDYLPDACIDLVYLDPPFNSNRSYNVLFKEEGGRESQALLAGQVPDLPPTHGTFKKAGRIQKKEGEQGFLGI